MQLIINLVVLGLVVTVALMLANIVITIGLTLITLPFVAISALVTKIRTK